MHRDRILKQIQSGRPLASTSTWTNAASEPGRTDICLFKKSDGIAVQVERYLDKFWEASDLWEEDSIRVVETLDEAAVILHAYGMELENLESR